MFLTALLVVLHVFAVGWFVAGVVGRNVSSAFARRATTIEAAAGLLRATEYFDARMVIPGSGLVLILGLAAAWAADWPILGFIQGADVNWLLLSLVLYVALIPFVPLVVAPRRQARKVAFEKAVAAKTMTPELRAALDDKGVAAYRSAELIVIAIIAVLMVAKPF